MNIHICVRMKQKIHALVKYVLFIAAISLYIRNENLCNSFSQQYCVSHASYKN